MNSPFENPYGSLPPNRVLHTSVNIDITHASLFKTLYGRNGAIQTTIAILVNKLYEQLIKSGFQPEFNPERFEHAVADATLTLGGEPAANLGLRGGEPGTGRSAEAVERDDRRGVGRLGPEAQGCDDQHADSQCAPAKTGSRKEAVRGAKRHK